MQCKGSIFLVTDLFQNDCMGVQFVGSIDLGLVSFLCCLLIMVGLLVIWLLVCVSV